MKIFKQVLIAGLFALIAVPSAAFHRAAAWSAGVPAGPFAVYLPIVIQSTSAQTLPASGNWLEWVNFYRASAYLPPVTENPVWSDGDVKHARYTVKNNILMHDEDTSNPWYTAEGKSAAQTSNIMASSSSTTSDQFAVELWMRGPFHAVGILDPRLTTVGFGSYREADGGYQMAAALNVISGINYNGSATYPAFWPGNNAFVPLTSYTGGESPDPLASCSGYSVPSGLPLIVQMGSGNHPPAVTAQSLTLNGASLAICEFDETNYVNTNSASQSTGRAVLASRNAIILIPRQPLSAGSTYTASVTTNGKTYSWSFRIGSN